MTAPATATRDEIRELIEAQIKTFGQPTPLTPSERGGSVPLLKGTRYAREGVVGIRADEPNRADDEH